MKMIDLGVSRSMKKLITFGLLLFMLGSGMLWAAVKAPQDIVQDTSAQMLDALRKNRETLRQDSSRIYDLVDQLCCQILTLN